MPWSTREVASLAGTTVNTVRHYHRVGLLEEPDRMSNGYKKYQVRHLVRLLQIRRLRDLGVPIDNIEHAGTDGETSSDTLAAIDVDLAKSIERLQRARAEISAIVQGSSATDVPSGFESVAPLLSTPERALLLISSQLYDEASMADFRRMIEDETVTDEVGKAFNALEADASEDERRRISERYASSMAKALVDYPWLNEPSAHLSTNPRVAQAALVESIAALFNPAQLDVIARASVIAQQLASTMATNGDNPPSDSKG